MSKIEVKKKIGEDSGNVKLLREIETISKALYVDKNQPRSSISGPGNRSKSLGRPQSVDSNKPKLKYGSEDSSNKDKRSIWNWKPLKAFSIIKNRKFNCCFSLVVHSIEGLPSSFEDVCVCVHWKRRDGELVTNPVKVSDGVAEFEEKLTHTCMTYGSSSGPHHSAKYESKHFLLFASAIGYQELDLGKHRVDLTRLLPLTLEELEEEKSSGKWTTTFKLSGEAKGAILNVSFGYTVVGDSPMQHGNNQTVPVSVKKNCVKPAKPVPKTGIADGSSTIRRGGSLPGACASFRSVENVKDLHEVLPTSRSEVALEDLKDSAFGYKSELDVSTEHIDPSQSKIFSPLSHSSHKNVEKCEESEFSVTEKRLEEPSKKEQEKPLDVKVDAVDVSVIEDNISDGFQIESIKGGDLHDFGNDRNLDNIVEPVPNRQEDEIGSGNVGNGGYEDGPKVQDSNFEEVEICSKETVMKALEDALINVANLETEALGSPKDKENEIDYGTNQNETPLSLDDFTESVANEFLDMLGIEQSPFRLSSESEPESPRERLLRQFEKDALAGGYSLFDFDIDQTEGDQMASDWGNFSEDFELESVIQAAKEEDYEMGTQAESSKARVKMLEDLETELLMHEWGLNDKVFQFSPTRNSGAFGSPIDLPPEEPLELPSLGEGVGPFLQTKNGGYLRSMNPTLFKNAKAGGNLVMQVSSPVVLPAEMGSGIADMLQQLASAGIEKLSMQANKLMPLEDITGKTMQQVAWEGAASLEGPESQGFPQHELGIGQDDSGVKPSLKKEKYSTLGTNNFKSNTSNEIGSEYVSLDDLAPLAMDKIEALSIEGLRVQSGMSDEHASANINAQSIGEISAFQGMAANVSGSLGLGAAGLQLLDIKDNGDDLEGLMGLSLTLDEWMRLDSGDVGDDDEISEKTSEILAAHHARPLDMIRGGKRRGKGSGRKCGLLGNNFTVALMVQLHDPIRNYEPVGTPMLALIQVERVFVPPKPKIYCKVSELRNESGDDDESEIVPKEKIKEAKIEEASEEEGIPQFSITEVQVSGLKTEPGKNKTWGTMVQQQSGSRWLLANGMGKANKNSFVKPKAISNKPATSLSAKALGGSNSLWSISFSRGK